MEPAVSGTPEPDRAVSGGRAIIRFCNLASGSKGNAIWVESDETAILVDNGLSGKELKRRMALVGLDPQRLKAIVVSHEHRDHTHGVGVLARMFKIPVYANQGTLNRATFIIGKINPVIFRTGNDFTIGDLRIHPISVSHDASDTVGFTFEANGTRLGLATDLGKSTTLVREHLSGCQGLILEFNHDMEMLINGPYPWDLKNRVKGRRGHLSNPDAAELLSILDHAGLKHVTLAHLSETNNQPELALEAARQAVSRPGFTLVAAEQDNPTGIITI